MGMAGGHVRPPMVDLSEAEKMELNADIKAIAERPIAVEEN